MTEEPKQPKIERRPQIMVSDEFLCSECDMDLTLDNCKDCAYRDRQWLGRFLKLKWMNIRDRLLHRNCTTCCIPVNGFCEHLHLAMLNQMVTSNQLTKDRVCDQYKRGTPKLKQD
jgi:hypothetical protein